MKFELIDKNSRMQLEEIARQMDNVHYNKTALCFGNVIQRIRDGIPQKKRISFGRYSVIKMSGILLYEMLQNRKVDFFPVVTAIFNDNGNDELVRGLALQLISIYGVQYPDKAWPFLVRGGADQHWEMREFAAGFIDKIIKVYPQKIKLEYVKLVKSDDANLRRFVAESLRPVRENKWFLKNPQYPFSILKHLFMESAAYPRSSVGNNLSDWARSHPEMVYHIVEKLVNTGNSNAFWIACRACRNLIKKEPLRVFDVLGIDQYQYKEKIYYRKDFN